MRQMRSQCFRLAFFGGVLVASLIGLVSGTTPAAHAQPQPFALATPPVLRASKAIWDAIVISNTSSCWRDAREAIDSALDGWAKLGRNEDWDLDYIDWYLGLAKLPINSNADKHLKDAAFEKATSYNTFGYDVALESTGIWPANEDDEWINVDIIESKIAERKITDGTSQLYRSITIVHGVSLCGYTEDKREDDAYFVKFTAWWDGYFEVTKGGKNESTSLDPAWAKQLNKKDFPNEGGVDVIECCQLPKTEEHNTTKTPTPTPTPAEKKKPSLPSAPRQTPKKKPAPPPLGKDPKYATLAPQPGTGTGVDEGISLPPIAGPTSVLTGTVYNPATGATGPTDYIVGVVQPDGKKTFWRGLTDQNGHFVFKLPEGAITAVTAFLLFDKNGAPDKGAETNLNATHVPDTDAVPNVSANQTPAILRADSSIQRGGASHGTFDYEVRGIDPQSARVVIDGRADGARVLAASDRSVEAQIDGDFPLGRHNFQIESLGKRSNAFPADILEVYGDPLPPQKVGTENTVRVHVIGLPEGDTATMTFEVGGAATLLNGQSQTVVPVTNGIAEVKIRGVHTGETIVHFKLNVTIPGFWQSPQS